MANFLAEMAAASEARSKRAMQIVPSAEMHRIAISRGPAERPAPAGFLMIAEVKLASPSEGILRAIGTPTPNSPSITPSAAISDAATQRKNERAAQTLLANATLDEVVKQASLYDANGANLISVLAEPLRFGGDLSHVAKAAASVKTPVMRKDFLVSPFQVYEARAVGASAVLLIVRMLDDATLQHMLSAAAECGMLAILEIFDRLDLLRAELLVGRFAGKLTICIGVNTRDLSTLQVSPDRLEHLSKFITPAARWIAESGLYTPADVTRAAMMGYSGALVGSALMKSPDPASLCREMVQAGAAAIAARSTANTPAPLRTPEAHP